jgi:uncharacterized repeat protein (TIGR03803 family)
LGGWFRSRGGSRRNLTASGAKNCAAGLPALCALGLFCLLRCAPTLAQAPNFSVLYSFDAKCANSPGAHCDPAVQDGVGVKVGAMVHGPAGDNSFYGATPGGGAHNVGTIFRITPAEGTAGGKTAAVAEVLYSFGVSADDGRNPSGGLTLGSDGNLYGTTYAGGEVGVGTIFRMQRRAGAPDILYSFRGGVPRKAQPFPRPQSQEEEDLAAAYPISRPVLGRDGSLYGVTPLSNPGAGVLYRLTPDRVLHSLHLFRGGEAEAKVYGLHPANLNQGSDGSFYGTTWQGARGETGTVFQTSPPGGIKTIYRFSAEYGILPNGVIQGTDGNLYGTTYSGGPLYRGVVFRLTVAGDYALLACFGGNASNPVAGVVEVLADDPVHPGSARTQGYYLYGVATMNYSAPTHTDAGILFRLREDGAGYPDGKNCNTGFDVVHNFDGVAGALPNVTPVLVKAGSGDSSLYGIAATGGKFFAGVFYRLSALNPPCPSVPPPASANAQPAGASCACQVPNFIPPSSCTPTWTPDASRWKGHALHLPNVDVYTDYCYGAKADGIMFLPKAADAAQDPTNAALNRCPATEIHIRQFVETTCPAGTGKCGQSYNTCTVRNLDAWYLDECNDEIGHLVPDGLFGGVHVISDQPDAIVNGFPVKKTFHDVVMCGTQVIDGFTWTRSGNGIVAGSCPVPGMVTYGDPQPDDPSKLAEVVCNLGNASTFQSDDGLAAIQRQAGGCPGQPKPGN